MNVPLLPELIIPPVAVPVPEVDALLEDLVLVALRAAQAAAAERRSAVMSSATGGIDMSGLGGLLG